MSTEEKTDLRVMKTRGAIKNAFKQMVLEMDASQITVKELAERAVIHRKTFYLHYTTIEALYEDILKDLSEAYYEQIDQLAPDAPFTEMNRVFFTFMAAQEPYIEKMVCTSSYSDYTDKLFLTNMQHNRARYNPYAAYSTEEQNIINTFLVSGSVNLYRRWIQDGKKLPLDKLIELSSQLFMYGVASIR